MSSVARYAGLLLFVSNILILSRLGAGGLDIEAMQPRIQYFFTIQIDADLHGDPAVIRSYLPADGEHQRIIREKIESQQLEYSLAKGKLNRTAVWKARDVSGHQYAVYDSVVDIQPMSYQLPSGFPIPDPSDYPLEVARYLEPTPSIQSDAPEVMEKAAQLRGPSTPADLETTVRSLYDFVQDEIHGSDYENTLDALTTLKWGEAFCGGKSRLLTALLRASDIPARLVGGIILKPGSKRITHVWVEAWINGVWVPFDALNHHYAEHPQNYLVLYHGDEALFSHTANINFRYHFNIKKWRTSPDEELRAGGGGLLDAYVFWEAFRKANISLNLLRLILLLPIGVTIVVLSRNVIGLTTFGTFHPALMAIAFRETGLLWGMGLYIAVLVLGMGLRAILDRLQLLHTPRLAILFLFVVAFMLSTTYVSIHLGMLDAAAVSLFPIAILAITIESFFTKQENLGVGQAFSVLAQTLLVLATIYWVLDSYLVQMIVYAFPEVLLAVVAVNLILGRWVGMRLVEHRRFRWFAVDWRAT